MRKLTRREADERASRLLSKAVNGAIGHIQRAVRRSFIIAGGAALTTGELARQAYPRVTRLKNWHRLRVREAAPRFAVPLGRAKVGRGRPVIWRPKAELMALIRRGKSIPGASQLASPPADSADKP